MESIIKYKYILPYIHMRKYYAYFIIHSDSLTIYNIIHFDLPLFQFRFSHQRQSKRVTVFLYGCKYLFFLLKFWLLRFLFIFFLFLKMWFTEKKKKNIGIFFKMIKLFLPKLLLLSRKREINQQKKNNRVLTIKCLKLNFLKIRYFFLWKVKHIYLLNIIFR